MNDRDPAALLRLAHELVDDTDAIIERHFSGEIVASAKPDTSLVTAADTEVEERLRSRLAEAFPTHGVLGEELGSDPGAGETRWIIDPIDGTHNFVRGIPVFATLLALERAGELVLGVVSAPALGRRWSAARGHGATVREAGRERAIRVSAIGDLAQAQLCFSSIRRLEQAGLLESWRAIVAGSWRDRGFGDFWGYMLVAQGSAEAMLEDDINIWDLAAPAAVLQEAGGVMTDLEGNASWRGPAALSSNGLLHETLVRALAS
jgi:histidinol-phosphatase